VTLTMKFASNSERSKWALELERANVTVRARAFKTEIRRPSAIVAEQETMGRPIPAQSELDEQFEAFMVRISCK
jgi:hypothetical protein